MRRAGRVLGEGRVEGLQGERRTWSTAGGLEGWCLGAAACVVWRESLCLSPFKHFKVDSRQTSALCLRSRHLLYFLLWLKQWFLGSRGMGIRRHFFPPLRSFLFYIPTPSLVALETCRHFSKKCL